MVNALSKEEQSIFIRTIGKIKELYLYDLALVRLKLRVQLHAQLFSKL